MNDITLFVTLEYHCMLRKHGLLRHRFGWHLNLPTLKTSGTSVQVDYYPFYSNSLLFLATGVNQVSLNDASKQTDAQKTWFCTKV